MKRNLIMASLASLLMLSCTTTKNSATDIPIGLAPVAAVYADVDVSNNKITYTMHPSAQIRRGGEKNVVNTAVREALQRNGGGDVLVEMQTTVKKKIGLFGSKIAEITVSGYPAKYRNFRNAK